MKRFNRGLELFIQDCKKFGRTSKCTVTRGNACIARVGINQTVFCYKEAWLHCKTKHFSGGGSGPGQRGGRGGGGGTTF